MGEPIPCFVCNQVHPVGANHVFRATPAALDGGEREREADEDAIHIINDIIAHECFHSPDNYSRCERATGRVFEYLRKHFAASLIERERDFAAGYEAGRENWWTAAEAFTRYLASRGQENER